MFKLRLLFFIILVFLCDVSIEAQLRYSVVGTFNKKGAQGMAINGKYAYLMNDGGLCRQYNLENMTVVKCFQLGCSSENPHVNNVCFGKETYNGSSIPLIYITECRKVGFRCFVEDISGEVPQVLQTIQAKERGEVARVYVWVVDTLQKALYTITRSSDLLDSLGSVHNTITKYHLPLLNQGRFVVLTEKDIVERFDITFPNVLQGCKIKGNKMYIVTGYQQSLGHLKDSKRAIHVVDLKKREVIKNIDLTYITTNEPEDVDFYKGKCLLYCGQEGGIYEIKMK